LQNFSVICYYQIVYQLDPCILAYEKSGQYGVAEMLGAMAT